MRQPAMEQIPKDPVSVQRFRKEPGPWDPIRLSGDTGKTPRNPPLPDADNQTSRLPHTLQYKIRSPDGISSIGSAVQLDQSPSSESGYGTSTSNRTGHHATQNSTSTAPTTTEASLRNEICHPWKSQDKELSSAESDESDGREASVEGHESVGGVRPLKGFKRLALRRNRSLEPDTRNRDHLRLIVRDTLGNLLRRVSKRVASPAGPGSPFIRDIAIADVNCEPILACALLDTQCHVGNWISTHLVERLGRQDEISHNYKSPNLTDAGDHEVVDCGIISLQWKWSPRGTRMHECKFFVFQSPDTDVIIGEDYIRSKKLLTINERKMLVMLAHNKAPTSEKTAIALALEEQKREKAALETGRIQSQQQVGQQQGGPSSQAQQSGQQGPTQTQGRQRPRSYRHTVTSCFR